MERCVSGSDAARAVRGRDPGGPDVSRRLAAIISISLLVLTAACVIAAGLILGQPHPEPLEMETTGDTPFFLTAIFVPLVVGALVLWRWPMHRIGWIYVISGFMLGVAAVSTAYTQYASAVPGSLPFGAIADFVSGASFILGVGTPVTLGLLLFPDGNLPSARWNWVLVITPVAFAILVAGGALADLDQPVAAVLEVTGSTLVLIAACASVLSLVVRWRASHGHERQQIKWIALAAAVFGLVLVIVNGALLFGPSPFLERWDTTLFAVTLSLIPIATGIAIPSLPPLRHRPRHQSCVRLRLPDGHPRRRLHRLDSVLQLAVHHRDGRGIRSGPCGIDAHPGDHLHAHQGAPARHC